MRIIILLLISIQGFGQLLPVVNMRSRVPQSVPGGTDSAQFNFNLTAQSVSGWTDVTGNPHTAIRTATAPSGIGVSTVGTSTTYWSPEASTTAANSAGQTGGTNDVFPEAVRTSYMFNKYPPKTNANIVLSGLVAGGTYTLWMIGSRLSGNVATATRLMQFQVIDANGTQTINDYDVKGNVTNNATFTVVAQAGGTIEIIINPDNPQDITNGPYGYLNGLKIRRNP